MKIPERPLRIILTVAFAGAFLPWSAVAQPARRDSAGGRFVAHTLLGLYMPRAGLQQTTDPGILIGGQLAYRVHRIAVVTGLTVTQSDDNRSAPANDPGRLTLVQFDAGVEAGAVSPVNRALRGFLGAGIGGRSYRYEAPPRPTVFAVYMGVGGEWRFRRGGIRAEARDYVSTGDIGADRANQHDAQLLAGIGYHFR